MDIAMHSITLSTVCDLWIEQQTTIIVRLRIGFN